MHCNVKTARQRTTYTALFLDKCVLRMHRNSYFRAAGQTSETADLFRNADFIYSTDIFLRSVDIYQSIRSSRLPDIYVFSFP